MFSRGLKGNTEQKWVKAELRKTLLINGSNIFGQLLTNLQYFLFITVPLLVSQNVFT